MAGGACGSRLESPIGYATTLETEIHSNWIGGAWRPPSGGSVFALEAAGAGQAWPRSGPADVELALRAGIAAAGEWARRPRERRAALLRAALEELAAGPAAGGDPPLGLGLEAEEVAQHRRAAVVAASETAGPDGDGAAGAGARPGGVTLVRSAAGTLFCGLVRGVWPALADGRPVLLLSDPALPAAAEELAVALERAGLPAGVLALLHDDGRTALRTATLRPEVDALRVRAAGEDLAEVRALLARRGGETWRPGQPAPFGAGVVACPPPAAELSEPQNRTAVVPRAADVARAARDVARAAFGRAAALSGQLDGQVGRAVCCARVFSAFSAALLHEVETLAAAPVVRGIDPGLPAHLARTWRLGLDEGATPVHGTPPGSRREGREVILTLSVFTNAEPGMRLVRATRPAPLLCLLRAEDDARARNLADELDSARDGAS